MDMVKIDKSFVDGLGEKPEDTAIVEAVISLARALGLTTVAEGIETTEQLERLRDLGCELGQGYYFSGALPAYEASALLLASAGDHASGRR
jgi:EAL domain-containing protein (putative c-di-GMP-specific phosphodiesterase class I)